MAADGGGNVWDALDHPCVLLLRVLLEPWLPRRRH